MASGNIAGTTVNGSSTLGANAPEHGHSRGRRGEGGQADDVNTALQPETACSVGMAPGRAPTRTSTRPSRPTRTAAWSGPLPDTFRYPSRKGFDEFFGYGRIDAYKSVAGGCAGPDPARGRHHLAGMVPADRPEPVVVRGRRLRQRARTSYTCRVEVAPGAAAQQRAQQRRAATSSPSPRPTATARACTRSRYNGLLATVSTATLKSLFPHGDPSSFTGNENGGPGLTQTSNGRPNTLPYAFTVRVVVEHRRRRRRARDDRRGPPPAVPAPRPEHARAASRWK